MRKIKWKRSAKTSRIAQAQKEENYGQKRWLAQRGREIHHVGSLESAFSIGFTETGQTLYRLEVDENGEYTDRAINMLPSHAIGVFLNSKLTPRERATGERRKQQLMQEEQNKNTNKKEVKAI